MKKKASKQERAYMGLVAELGCIICGGIPEIHHNTKNRGYGAKSSNYDIMPLCVNHHRGEEGIHHIGVKTWEAKYGDQDELVKRVRLRDIVRFYKVTILSMKLKELVRQLKN